MNVNLCSRDHFSKDSHCYRLSSPPKIEYKKGSKESQANYTLPQDMINLSHAKKAQALASDLEYRTKLHDYTVMPDDIKVQQAKKAYSLQSEVRGASKGRAPISTSLPPLLISRPSCCSAEPVSLGPELDEGSGLGDRGLYEHHSGQESRRAAQRC